MLDSFSLDWEMVVANLLRIAISFVLALPIGWERSHSSRRIGLRTFPLVAIASCGYMLLARHILDATADSQMRALQGLLTGIGFIGGGAILKAHGGVYGLATAASLWNTGAIGASVAFEREEIAVVLSLTNFLLLRLLTPFVEREREPLSDQDRFHP
jgi:putative Mg2+ transporter-C (MgtC) family protein